MLLDAPPRRTVDVCVVGAGPVGMSVALEVSRLGLDVLLVEAGSRRSGPDQPTPALIEGKVTHPPHHAPLGAGTDTGIGGTSWLWGGRCVPFEPVDFGVREHVVGPGWPIPYDEVRRWHDRAAEYLQCGSAFDDGDPGWPELEPVLARQQERWSRSPRLGHSLGARVIADHAIAVLSNATVTDLDATDSGVVRTIRVSMNGQEHLIAARRFVLSAGGLRTTRLLLQLQRRRSFLAGGTDGPLGRYYAGHLNGTIADIRLTSPHDFTHLDFRRDTDGTFVRRRLTLTPEVQRDERLLNIAFYLGNRPFADHRHRSGTLSALFLAMHLPWVGRRVARPETREHNPAADWTDRRRHLRNIARHPVRTATGLGRIIWRRYFSSPRLHVFVAPSDDGLYALRYHAEQTCRPENRITLSDDDVGGGPPGVEVVMEYSGQDVDSIVRAHALLDERLRAAGRGYLIYHDAEPQRHSSVRDQAVDGYHQIGSTRMSSDPTIGVVDTDSKVHGLANLYVASSSVFPTAGEANPTFTAVCLGVRLAHHLATETTARADRRPRDA